MAETAKQSGITLEKAYQFMLWLMPTVEKFPRSQKFRLGAGCRGGAPIIALQVPFEYALG